MEKKVEKKKVLELKSALRTVSEETLRKQGGGVYKAGNICCSNINRNYSFPPGCLTSTCNG